MIKVGILGGSGYGGSELLRLLLFHPQIELTLVTANEHAGKRIDAAYALNAFFEERRGRRAVKRAINRVLSALRLGDSLKISARRP